MTNNNPLFIVYDDLGLGGIQIKILDIVKKTQLINPNKKIILCLFEKKGIWLKKISPHVKIITAPKITLKGFRKFNKLLFVLWLVPKITKFNPKTILAFMNHPACMSIIAVKLIFWKKVKILIGQDCTTSIHISSQPNPHLNQPLIKLLYPLADKILVQTKTQKIDLVKNFFIKPKKIELSPNWLPLNFSDKPKKNIKKTDIVFIGRLDPQKNLKRFIDIISLIQKKIPGIKVKIIGSGSESEILQKYTKELALSKNIKFIPAVTNPKKFYSESKIYLLTSHYEGFPLTILEAISQNCIPVFFNLPEVSGFFTKFQRFVQFKSNKEACSKIIFLMKNEKIKKTILDFYSKKVFFQQEKNISRLLTLIN